MGPKSPSSDVEIIDEPARKPAEDMTIGQGNETILSGNISARGTARGSGRVVYGKGRGFNSNNTVRNPNLTRIGAGNDAAMGNNRWDNSTNYFDGSLSAIGKAAATLGFNNKYLPSPSGINDGGRLARYQEFIDGKLRTNLASLKGQSMKNLTPLDQKEKKFSGRAHLYVGGIPTTTTEKELKEWFGEHGEVGDVYYKKDKLFAFVRMGTRSEAEKAKNALDGQIKNRKTLRVKFAVHQAAIKVSNLGPWVSNELLHTAFSVFGEIERCLVYSDERGRSKEEGIVEFEKKGVAMEAVRRCNEGCFFLCTSLRPVFAEMIEHVDDGDGFQEKSIPKSSNEYHLERETAPRFAMPDSFEFEYGTKWKGLYELKKQKEEALNVEMKLEETKLLAQMEYSRFEHETDMLREELRKKEAARDQQKSVWSIKEKYMEDIMKQEHEKQRSLEEGIFNRIQNKATGKTEDNSVSTQDEISNNDIEVLNKRQRKDENSLFSQAQQLSNILDLQESLMGLAQNSNGLANEGTLEQLNALLNMQGNLGNGINGNATIFDTYIDAEDMHLQGELASLGNEDSNRSNFYGSKASKRRRN